MARLSNTASGTAGEAAVVALFLRAGLLVAKPYWGDDEVDLLVFIDNDTKLLAIPVQVKSVQSAPEDVEVAIQGLRKRYVEGSRYLCLAIYSVDQNKVWLIPTAEQIKKAYIDWADDPNQPKVGRKRTKYDKIADKDCLPLRVNVTRAGSPDFDEQWLLKPDDFGRIQQVFNNVANAMQMDREYVEKVKLRYIGSGGISLGGTSPAVPRPASNSG